MTPLERPTLLGWLVVSIVYLAYAGWIRFRYPDVSVWASATFFLFGAGFFIFVNRHWWFSGWAPPSTIEWIAIALVFIAFFAARRVVLWAHDQITA